MLVFLVCASMALLLRKDSAAHKRLILLGTSMILVAAYNPWWGESLCQLFSDGFLGMIVHNFAGPNMLMAVATAYVGYIRSPPWNRTVSLATSYTLCVGSLLGRNAALHNLTRGSNYMPASQTTEVHMQYDIQPAVLTLNEFIAWAKIGRTKAYREITTGRLRAIKIGRRTLIPFADANAWLMSHPDFNAGEGQ